MLEPEYGVMSRREEGHFWYRALHSRTVALLRAAALGPRPLLLDAGCGTGGMARVLERDLGARVTGCDAARQAAANAKGLPGGGFVVADANALPFAGARFDGAVCLDVLSCRSVEPARALAELRRCLRPGGAAVVNVPAFAALRGRHDAAADVHRRFRLRELEALVAGAGLRLESAGYWNTALAAVMLPWRLFSRLVPGPASSDVGLTPAFLDGTLSALLEGERRFLADPPFGASLMALARRPG